MKNKTNAGWVALLLLLGSASCSKFVDGYEVSPNSPTETNPALLTTVIQVATFSHFTGQFARHASIMTQQCAGTQAQYEDLANYAILEGDNNNEWKSHYSAITDCDILIDLAGDANPYYRGIAKVLKAMNLGLTTDLWGDVPNREAGQGLNGEAYFHPAYDAQETVCQDIQTLLAGAITDLSKEAGANTLLPGLDDLIFNGDASQWIITAHVLRARYENHLSKRDPAGSATRALAAIDAAIAAGLDGAVDDCMAVFPGDGNSLNQWYAFQNDRGDYIKMAQGFVVWLKSINDPRLNFYAAPDVNGEITGTPLGSTVTTSSDVGAFFASTDSPAPLVSYVEARFIEAESALRAGNKPRAANAHNEAVKAHIKQVTGADAPPGYIASQASETEGTITLEKIMTHKHTALFTQFEVYNDWRRTNIPALSPNPNAAIAGIPRRLPTPSDERLYNTNAPVISDILKPVWWDE
ncbi:MAG: SusD/RagB family nutrient-binding outer membrane lipoprotein [Saprospirales bacterium]|nr:SusD/RagB family nutrient-binding outer membrane lipoprotein [Saprospirales bacterium]MBK8923301.1 SusD/RagB family nutrient-binding outer membrane lipoprotein [Saprospirales bacterium]